MLLTVLYLFSLVICSTKATKSQQVIPKAQRNFEQLIDDFKSIEDDRQKELKRAKELLQLENSSSNRSANFLVAATHLDAILVRMRVYCEAARIVLSTINHTRQQGDFDTAMATMKEEKTLGDQMTELVDAYTKMETAADGLTDDDCLLLHPLLLALRKGQVKLQELALLFQTEYQDIIRKVEERHPGETYVQPPDESGPHSEMPSRPF